MYKERDRLGQVHVVLQNANKLDEIKKTHLQEHALTLVREVNYSLPGTLSNSPIERLMTHAMNRR